MTDEITPARLRELAKICDPPVDHINVSLAAPEIAAALRAAADDNERLTATLAAREALLRRAMDALIAAEETIVVRRDGVEVDRVAFTPRESRDRARALAAEIAAALKEKTDADL